MSSGPLVDPVGPENQHSRKKGKKKSPSFMDNREKIPPTFGRTEDADVECWNERMWRLLFSCVLDKFLFQLPSSELSREEGLVSLSRSSIYVR